MNWDRLYFETYKQFDCDDLTATGAMRLQYSRNLNERQLKKEIDRRKEKQRNTESTLTRFRSLMESPDPPKTKEEAVAALSPIVAYLLWSIFKMLAIKVIEWAWDRYHEQQQELAAGKAK